MKRELRRQGFTIVELMIATTVFSVILIVATSGVIAIGRLYYKGITSAKTQEATRSIMESVARSQQFSSQGASETEAAAVFDGKRAICFGEDRYSYIINQKVTDDPNIIGLRYDTRDTTELTSCQPADDGEQLLGSNMRLVDFAVTDVDNKRFRIAVKVAFGDNDLLNIYENDGTTPTPVAIKDAQCRSGIAGSNFCSVSELSTIVNLRLGGI